MSITSPAAPPGRKQPAGPPAAPFGSAFAVDVAEPSGRGDDAFLMWRGYFDEIMRATWRVYGWEPDPEEPGQPNLDQVPLLRTWNENRIESRTWRTSA
jgi:hypothetical protein